jgi:site-specific DNA recombinase
MASCVIYARVSTKEQQAEGYSIPAQTKAMRAFCEAQGLAAVAEFIEAESAGKAGRTRFAEMVAYLQAHPDVRVVVAHKLDRLYRNFRDQITLEDLGVKARYVVGDIPDTPQGELLRDVNLSVAKFYLGNLREEVRKGMDEKVAQGGWPHLAPTGYVNDRETRSIIPDPETAPLVRYAFERYSAGDISLAALAADLNERGLRSRSGHPVGTSMLHKLLRNPIYAGDIRYKGQTYPGAHEPLIARELFDAVQLVFAPRQTGPKRTKHVFALRDYLVCGECGCKVTAERQKGYVYYRCTKGKGKEACSQRRYTREELLLDQLDSVLSGIEITPEIVDMLVRDSRALDEHETDTLDQQRSELTRKITELDSKASKLLDSYLDGIVPVDAYRVKADEIAESRRTLERRLASLKCGPTDKTAKVEAVAKAAMGARSQVATADTEGKRRLLNAVVLNAELTDCAIGSYQLKRPFEYLRRDPEGAFLHPWWALEDLNL